MMLSLPTQTSITLADFTNYIEPEDPQDYRYTIL